MRCQRESYSLIELLHTTRSKIPGNENHLKNGSSKERTRKNETHFHQVNTMMKQGKMIDIIIFLDIKISHDNKHHVNHRHEYKCFFQLLSLLLQMFLYIETYF